MTSRESTPRECVCSLAVITVSRLFLVFPHLQQKNQDLSVFSSGEQKGKATMYRCHFCPCVTSEELRETPLQGDSYSLLPHERNRRTDFTTFAMLGKGTKRKREMAKLWRTLSSLPMDLGSIPTTHMEAHNLENLIPYIQVLHKHTCRPNSHTPTVKIHLKGGGYQDCLSLNELCHYLEQEEN